MNYKELKLDLLSIKVFLMGLLFVFFSIGGAVFNLMAVATNGGRMPVKTDLFIETTKHFSFQHNFQVNNPFLCDIFRIDLFGYWSIFSIGDALMFLMIPCTIGLGIYFFIRRHKIKKS